MWYKYIDYKIGFFCIDINYVIVMLYVEKSYFLKGLIYVFNSVIIVYGKYVMEVFIYKLRN